ncbi:rod shape-determining protein RodA [Falsirhodobacter sp. alg1]|uniref:rod shape-determining protein RodA n=1 Tax=Falsirhodobacter sp. alg1 TaxID=1472418 RepID=UPI0005F0B883|nr:rod shape-determining protein RodA [Falsirhodobacter sp. alg1]
MSFLEYRIQTVPTGLRKALYLNWPLVLLLTSVCAVGWLMLYSVAGGDITVWAEPQMKRFVAGLSIMLVMAFIPIWFWRNISGVIYLGAVGLLVAVDVMGHVGMGAQRWLNLGFIMLQPSEVMKIALVMMLAAYYDWLPPNKVSHPLWVAVPLVLILLPVFLVMVQPDLGTAILLMGGGAVVMFCAGVSLWYFAVVLGAGVGLVTVVLASRGKSWQLLRDYQFKRIDTFLDPSTDPLGAGYHITQAKIALGSGGWTGRGFMQGTQSRLNFLPEKHTDFIFTVIAEELGFIGACSLLILYVLIIAFCIASAVQMKDRFAALVTLGIAASFFFLFAVNMLMVMGLAPVVGVPLPLVSYGGSAMMVLLTAFGIVQSAHVHRARDR